MYPSYYDPQMAAVEAGTLAYAQRALNAPRNVRSRNSSVSENPSPAPVPPKVEESAASISAALQRVLDGSDRPLDVLIVDGLIKYLFDPSAPPGEGLITSGPPAPAKASGSGYMFRLEQRVSARSTYQDMYWPDMDRYPAGLWDGPLPPAQAQPNIPLPGLPDPRVYPTTADAVARAQVPDAGMDNYESGRVGSRLQTTPRYHARSEIITNDNHDSELVCLDAVKLVATDDVTVSETIVAVQQNSDGQLMNDTLDLEGLTISQKDPDPDSIVPSNTTNGGLNPVSSDTTAEKQPPVHRRGRQTWVKMELGNLY